MNYSLKLLLAPFFWALSSMPLDSLLALGPRSKAKDSAKSAHSMWPWVETRYIVENRILSYHEILHRSQPCYNSIAQDVKLGRASCLS